MQNDFAAVKRVFRRDAAERARKKDAPISSRFSLLCQNGWRCCDKGGGSNGEQRPCKNYRCHCSSICDFCQSPHAERSSNKCTAGHQNEKIRATRRRSIVPIFFRITLYQLRKNAAHLFTFFAIAGLRWFKATPKIRRTF